ncbi:DUF6247 family protein [Sphaerimonospora mesophila]|uniref:DUF6247 family protein n=1 Tax=Sphaerimonospora mesophila TaxID=37483 RepID=UPI0006E21B9B
MSAQPVHDPRYDPQAILQALPDEWRPRFLTEYEAALDAARRPEQFHRLHELLHVWWLRSVAYSDPTYGQGLEDVLHGTGMRVPLEVAIPDWEERLARARRP